jgi:class 3 adenylate cyclase/tetratricopeptide (TPR) repeat protein
MQERRAPGSDVLAAYLPGTLIGRWARYPEQPPIWGHWLTGSLMHCDITGFTAMSESLSRLGKEGAELMAGVLNGFFDRMLGVGDRWGGVQMKFGGDALLLFFSGREQAARAAVCGLEMQAGMADFRRVSVGGQTYRLRMRVGIHSGRFFSASVGQPEGVLHYALVGSDVNRTAEVEAAAKPGQVALSAETAALLDSRARLTAAAGGVWRLRGFDLPPKPPGQGQMPHAPSGDLGRYLLPPIAARLAEGQTTEYSGEHRRVTALFINLLGLSALLEGRGKGEALAQLDAYMNMLLAILDGHRGFLAGSDAAEDGDKLIVLFGAPLSQEGEEASALRCALDLQRQLEDSSLDLRQRIGINTGFVFAGEIGSARRREYTVIGDSVNLAARLMAAARPGQTMLSGSTAKRAGAEFELRRLRPIRVKGKSAPVEVYRLEDARLPPRPPETAIASPVLGRDAELASLLKVSRQAALGRGRWAYVWGGAGIGKSRLAAEVAARLRSRGWRQLVAYCQPHTVRVPFAVWIGPLRALFGIEAGDSPQDAWRKVETEVARLRPDLQAFAPLVGELLSLPADEEPLLRSLDTKTRRQRLTATVVQILHAAAREQPLLFLLEDVHWADGPSLELLAELLSHLASSLMVCLTSRQEAPPPELSAGRPSLCLHLRELPAEDARRLVASSADLADDEVMAIVGRAQGNPLFLQELARGGAVRPDDLPETINDVMMARLDRLPHEEKTVLRLASVIGPSFELRVLQTLLPRRLELPQLEEVLADLSQRGLTLAEEVDPPTYRFCHVLTQEVAYETLPYAQRRRLHRGVADHIERDRADQPESVCELLFHHYDLAGEPAKTVRYGAMSGDRAAAMFANREAIEYYRRSLAALKAAPGGTSGDRSLLLERVGDCLETAGNHSEATDAFAQALKQWKEGRGRARRLVPGSIRAKTREAVLCRKAGVSCERSSGFDESLRWLDRALAALPRRLGRVGSQVCAAKSVSLFRKGLYAEGVRWGRRALELARRSGESRELAYAHNMLASSYIEQGALRMAIRHLRPAVRLYHELGDFPGQAAANNNLGSCYQLLGALDAALYHYRVALAADEWVGDLVDAAVVHNNIGEVLLALGELDEAVAHLEEVVRVHQSDADLAAVAGLAQVNLCRCRLGQRDLDAAESHLRRGLRLLRRVGAQGLLMEARLQLAELRLAQDRAEEARRECRRALRRAKALDARLLEARGERLLGEAEAALGETEAARSHLRASVALARRIGADHEEARSLIALGGLWPELNAALRGAARTALERAAGILSRMGAKLELAEANRLLARLD